MQIRSRCKTPLTIVALICVALSLSACRGPEDLIVGKWKIGQEGLKVEAEFDKKGVATLTMFGQKLRGEYKLAGGELEWTVNGRTTRYQATVSATELELTDGGQTIVYKRE